MYITDKALKKGAPCIPRTGPRANSGKPFAMRMSPRDQTLEGLLA